MAGRREFKPQPKRRAFVPVSSVLSPRPLRCRWSDLGAATEGDPYRQSEGADRRVALPTRRSRGASARAGGMGRLRDPPLGRISEAGVAAGRRKGGVQRSRKSLFFGEGLDIGRSDYGPYRRFLAVGFGRRRDKPWVWACFRGRRARNAGVGYTQRRADSWELGAERGERGGETAPGLTPPGRGMDGSWLRRNVTVQYGFRSRREFGQASTEQLCVLPSSA